MVVAAGPMHGTPPPAWGQPPGASRRREGLRYTPTRVGTTDGYLTAASGRPVHPHPRGDNRQALPPAQPSVGTPPPAWGQRLHSLRVHVGIRYTPTRVGTTSIGDRPNQSRTVHPHPRGDNSSGLIANASITGTPPPAWGQLLQACVDRLLHRYTPTRVGTTCCRGKSLPASQVHPHPRGDNQ